MNLAQQGLLSVMRVPMGTATGQSLCWSCAGRPICQPPVHFPRHMWQCHRGQEESGECLTPSQAMQSFLASLPSDAIQAWFHFCTIQVAVLSANRRFLLPEHLSRWSGKLRCCPHAGRRKNFHGKDSGRQSLACVYCICAALSDCLLGLAVSLSKYLTETVQFLLRKSIGGSTPVRVFRGETS